MENYRVLMEINRKEIFGERISNKEKQEAVSVLLNGVSRREDADGRCCCRI